MPSKLISYILGGALAFSFIPELKASDQEEDKPKKSGRRAKVAAGYIAPPTSLAVADTKEGSEFLTKLRALEQERQDQEDLHLKSSSTSSQKDKRKVKKASPSEATSSKKKRAYQPPISRVPVTKDVPLEEASSAPHLPATEADDLMTLSLLAELLPDSKVPTRKEITTIDVATFMPSQRNAPSPSIEEVSSSSPSSPKKKKKKGPKKTESAEATSSQTSSSKVKHFVGKAYTPQQLWEIIPPENRPQMHLRKAVEKSKGLITPEEILPLYVILALNDQTKAETKKGPTGINIQTTTYGKVFIPHANMSVSYKFTIGSSKLLKETLHFDVFSKLEEIQLLQKILHIKTTEDFSQIPSSHLQKAKSDIDDLTKKHFHATRIRAVLDSEEQRADDMATLGEKVHSTFGIYNFFEDNKRIPDLQIQLEFSVLKLIIEE